MSVSILRQALGRPLFGDDAVQALEEVDLVLGVPGHALAAVAELRHERAQRGEALVEVGVVALDHRHRRHGLAGDRLAFAALPVLHVERLRDLGRRVVHDGREHHVLLDAQHLGRDLARTSWRSPCRSPSRCAPPTPGPPRPSAGG